MRTIELNGQPVSGGKTPLVCAPLVSRTRADLMDEVERVVAKNPDILEWRVDFFGDIANTEAVVATTKDLKLAASGIPILFTCRSAKEGGTHISLTEEAVVRMYRAVCDGGGVQIVDYEMSNEPRHLQAIRDASRAACLQMLMSFHNFHHTPGYEFLLQKFMEAERLGADIAKVAVMPRDMDDVLTLLRATLHASDKLRIPLVSMSMGGLGCLTRLCGWSFGSAMTFAVGANSSAPGQMPIEDVNAGVALIRKALGDRS